MSRGAWKGRIKVPATIFSALSAEPQRTPPQFKISYSKAREEGASGTHTVIENCCRSPNRAVFRSGRRSRTQQP